MMPTQYRSFMDWLDATRAAALNLVSETGAKNTEQFMQFLTLWATAMPDPTEFSWQSIAGANKSLDAAALFQGRPFAVSALRLDPGCILPLHCHPSGGAVSVCTQGSLVMKHYELVAGSAVFTETGATAEVDEVSVASLTKNRLTQFTPTRANLHTFIAGTDGATLVEIAVQWAGTGEFSYLKLEKPGPAPLESIVRRYRGNWVGMNIALAYS
jgi:quercetin dioxygenase-like cupin family protein